jgi:putative iron-regulated protein
MKHILFIKCATFFGISRHSNVHKYNDVTGNGNISGNEDAYRIFSVGLLIKNLFIIPVLALSLVTIYSCKDDNTPDNSSVVTVQVLTDFAEVLVVPNYKDIQNKANDLNSAVHTLTTSTTEANLNTARAAWRSTRAAWELAEGYLIGPIEDNNYDPILDTWPLNKTELDSLLASTNPLAVADINPLPYSLKGFHAIEYILFGVGGKKLAANITAREKQYLNSLSQNLYVTTAALYDSWDATQAVNFADELAKAGNGSSRFATRKDAFIAIVTSMAGICEEVAEGKMEEPLAAQDSTLEESQFSHNSTNDFQNNIRGVLNAYLCKYTADGHGLNEIVAAKNISLDNAIQSQMNAAIASFNAINPNYGTAIFTQHVQIHNAQQVIGDLEEMLQTDLMEFIQKNIGD